MITAGIAVVMQMMAAMLAPFALLVIRSSMRSEARKLALTQLSPSHAVSLDLTSAAFNDAIRDEGKELELAGVMYDIISVVHHTAFVHVVALRDNAETGLNKLIGIKCNNGMSKDKRTHSLFALILNQLSPSILAQTINSPFLPFSLSPFLVLYFSISLFLHFSIDHPPEQVLGQ